jgi:hypothetical protein
VLRKFFGTPCSPSAAPGWLILQAAAAQVAMLIWVLMQELLLAQLVLLRSLLLALLPAQLLQLRVLLLLQGDLLLAWLLVPCSTDICL